MEKGDRRKLEFRAQARMCNSCIHFGENRSRLDSEYSKKNEFTDRCLKHGFDVHSVSVCVQWRKKVLGN